MAYEEYKNAGRTSGKLLYQLCAIGVPVTRVERLTINSGEVLTENGVFFATYKWNENDIPVFNFNTVEVGMRALPQLPIYTAMQDNGVALVPAFSFSREMSFNTLVDKHKINIICVFDKDDQDVTVKFRPPTDKGSLASRISSLQGVFR